MDFVYKVKGGDFANAGTVSSSVKKVLKQLNVQPKIIKRIVVALYEAEMNVVAHAYQGDISVEINTQKIVISVQDKGPGIENIDKAMQEGYSTASSKVREMGFGAGMGLPNIKKNVDKLTLDSVVNKGTELKFLIYLVQ